MPRKKINLPPAKTYFRPRIIPHSPDTAIPPRTGVWHPTYQPERAPSRIGIRERPDGSFEIPRRTLDLQGGRLTTRNQVFKDINAAMRAMGMHIPHHVRNELRHLHTLFDELRRYHGVGVDHWNRLSDTQKKALVSAVTKSHGQLMKNPDLAQSELKKQIVERLTKTIRLFEEKNPNAAIVTLGSAARDVLQRYNELLAQRVYLPRRERSLREMKTRRETVIFKSLRDLMTEFARMKRLSQTTPHERARFQRLLEGWQRYFNHPHQAKIPGYARAAKELAHAAQLCRNGKYADATTPLREANKAIALELSKTADFYPDLIATLARSNDTAWKKTILQNQARLVAENIEYWAERGFPEGFGEYPSKKTKGELLGNFFNEWAHAAQTMGLHATQRQFLRARIAFRGGRIETCSAILEKIADET